MKISQRIQRLEARRTGKIDLSILIRIRRVAPGMLDQPSGELRTITAHGLTWLRADDESEDQFKTRIFTETETSTAASFACYIGFDYDRTTPANAPGNARG